MREPGSLRPASRHVYFGDAEVVEHFLGRTSLASQQAEGHDRMLTQLDSQSDDNSLHVGLDQVVVEADAVHGSWR